MTDDVITEEFQDFLDSLRETLERFNEVAAQLDPDRAEMFAELMDQMQKVAAGEIVGFAYAAHMVEVGGSVRLPKGQYIRFRGRVHPVEMVGTLTMMVQDVINGMNTWQQGKQNLKDASPAVDTTQ